MFGLIEKSETPVQRYIMNMTRCNYLRLYIFASSPGGIRYWISLHILCYAAKVQEFSIWMFWRLHLPILSFSINVYSVHRQCNVLEEWKCEGQNSEYHLGNYHQTDVELSKKQWNYWCKEKKTLWNVDYMLCVTHSL